MSLRFAEVSFLSLDVRVVILYDISEELYLETD
jgi:hypothetical protein